MGVPLRTKTAHPPGWADHMVGGAGGEGDEGHWLYPGSGQAPLRQGSGHVALGSFPHVSFLEGQDITVEAGHHVELGEHVCDFGGGDAQRAAKLVWRWRAVVSGQISVGTV